MENSNNIKTEKNFFKIYFLSFKWLCFSSGREFFICGIMIESDFEEIVLPAC